VLGPDRASGDSNPIDGQGHGTHVAGIAAAKADNGVGSAGVCPDCTVLAVKVFADGASSASTFTIAQGITWAVDNGADVVNLSLGGTTATTVMRDAVDYAWSHGVVVVAAAGNSATSAQHYPAAYPNAIAVGSTTSSDVLSSFSNFGSWVDLVAPGSGILSTIRGGGYELWSGTSMATPVVAGAAGLAIAADPDAGAAATRAAVEAAVVDLGAAGRDATYGSGRVALDRLALGAPEPPGPPPAPTPPAIVTSSLPAGVVGTAYTAMFAATAGTPPYSWSVVDGMLPAGLTLSVGGALTGTPTAAGSAAITVGVTDANGLADSGSFTVSIAPAPQPDLAGSWRSARRYGSRIRGEFRLQLSGAAVAATTVRFQLITSSGGVLSQRDVGVTSLAPGTRTLIVDFTRPSGSATLRLRAVIDPAGTVAESNEQNNAADVTVR
jgi:subtilisin family serine protease